MNNLYDQLMFNWERGFYSVVKDKWDDYYVVSIKSLSGAFFVTEPHTAIDAAKHQVGNSKEYQDYLLEQMADAKNGGWKILENETFHPNSLMGKGFQVGDKVKIGKTGPEGTISKIDQDNVDGLVYTVHYAGVDACFFQQDLKPVLPQEEKPTMAEGAHSPQLIECARCKCVTSNFGLSICGYCSVVEHGQQEQESKESNPIPLEKLPQYCKHHVQINNCYACNFCKEEENKECVHAPKDLKQGWAFNGWFSYPLWLCKCGLVTCLDPNK